MSQAAMAEAGGVGLNSQSNYENGHRSPDATYLEKVAAAGVDVAYLLLGTRTAPGQRFFEPVPERELESRPVGWQTCDGPVLAFAARKKDQDAALIQLAEERSVRWVDGSIACDFVLSAAPSSDSSPMDRMRMFAAQPDHQRSRHRIEPEQLRLLLSECLSTGEDLRRVLWLHFFKHPSNSYSGAVFRFLYAPAAAQTKVNRLFRLDHVVSRMNGPNTTYWLRGNWESSGDIAEVSLDRIEGELWDVGSNDRFEPLEFARSMAPNPSIQPVPLADGEPRAASIRQVTAEEAALLDNYAAADESGRAAARRVLDALAQPAPKRANG